MGSETTFRRPCGGLRNNFEVAGLHGVDERPKICIILVNWNGWRDTTECLESVFRLDYPNYSVIVCDNASEDQSLDRIAEWASGAIQAECTSPALRHLVLPPCPRPIAFCRIGPDHPSGLKGKAERLFLVETGANLGFAGGNNVGLRLAMACEDFAYAWLLNNDTVVDRASLSALVDRMQACPGAGICGSTLLYYRDPDRVQALAGSSYNQWTARGHHIGAGPRTKTTLSPEATEARMRYVVGASMLVSRELLERVGLMSENYFLYNEEIDWATRARRHFSLAYAPGSLVYHKEGGSIGTARQSELQPAISEYYATRNRILFTRRFHPFALPGVLAAVTASLLHRLSRRSGDNARAILRAGWDALRGIEGRSFPIQRRRNGWFH